jgi:hypothetical protein
MPTDTPALPSKKRLTPTQKIARLKAELARQSQKARSLEAGQKIIVGAVAIALAERDPAFRLRLLEALTASVTRPADRRRIEPLIEDLAAKDAP